MSELEQVIRPFTGGTTSPPQQYFQQGQVGVPPVILRYGRGGSGKLLTGSASISVSSYVTSYYNEKKTADWGTQN